jgi:hypothetical protein
MRTVFDLEGKDSLPSIAKNLQSQRAMMCRFQFSSSYYREKEKKLIHSIIMKRKMNDLGSWGIEMFSFHPALRTSLMLFLLVRILQGMLFRI